MLPKKIINRVLNRVGFSPSKKQYGFITDPHRFRVMVGGSRFGKSMVGGFLAFLGLLIPDFRTWIVATSYNLCNKELRWTVEFLQKYKISSGRSLYDLAALQMPQKGPRTISMPWGSIIETKSTEQEDDLLGEELDLILLGEGSKLPTAIWNDKLRARIGPRNGRLACLSTGANDFGVFLDFIERGKSEDPEWSDWSFLKSSTVDNPLFSLEEYEAALVELPMETLLEQYEGEIVCRQGRVFEKIETYSDTPAELYRWPVFRAVQRGFNNPFVCLFVAVEPGSRNMYVFRELYCLGALLPEMAKNIKEASHGLNIVGTMGDFADGLGAEEFGRFGVNIVVDEEEKGLNKKVALVRKIQAVQGVIRQGRLFVHDSCVSFLEEMYNLKWPDRQREGKDRAEIEIPLTKYLQGPFCLSHIVSYIETARGVDVLKIPKRRKNYVSPAPNCNLSLVSIED